MEINKDVEKRGILVKNKESVGVFLCEDYVASNPYTKYGECERYDVIQDAVKEMMERYGVPENGEKVQLNHLYRIKIKERKVVVSAKGIWKV